MAAATLTLAGCSSSTSGGSPSSDPASRTTLPATSTSGPAPTEPTVRPTTTTKPTVPQTTETSLPPGWTEAELLSQLIMVGAQYSDPGTSTQMVREGAGGLVFFGAPAAGTGPVLESEITALNSAARIAPFMSTDEEGGEIARLSNLVGALPWPRQMAGQWTPAELTTHLASVARTMKALGMNMDLAPVLDTASATDTIDDEDDRSFSENGATAGAYGLAFLQGLSDGGVIGVAKHFPGLGHANGDTDTAPATDPPLSQLLGDDLVAFKDAVSGGARVVMMSNVTDPTWGTTPASLNRTAYSYLREMGFQGVILTDSLDAGAISDTGVNGAHAVVDAIEAGADMAMVTTATDFPAALSGLEAAVSSGRLAMSQVIRSVARIVAVKNSILPASEHIALP